MPAGLRQVAVLAICLCIAQVALGDPYEVLGLPADANQQAIRRAFRKLSLKYHPDKHSGSEEIVRKYREIIEAYELLQDEDARRQFDEFGGGQKFYSRAEFERFGKGSASADLYGASSAVRPADWRLFQTRLSRPAVIEYYASWCGHCQEFAPSLKRIALLFQEDFDFFAVNCEKQQQLCMQHRIPHYPVLRVYSAGAPPGNGETFNGHLTEESVSEFLSDWISDPVQSLDQAAAQAAIRRAQQTNLPLIIDFATGWCGPCQALQPFVRQMAKQMEGVAIIAKVDCDQQRFFCESQVCADRGVTP